MLPASQLPKDLRIRSEADYAFVAQAMRALANPARLRLLRYLSEPHYLEEIASEMRITRTAANRHIKVLLDAGLVAKVPGDRDKVPVVDYVVVPERMFRLVDETRRLAADTPRRGATPPDLWRTTPASRRAGAEGAAQAGARLLEVYGLHVGREHVLDPGRRERGWVIGRADDAAVRLGGDPYASQRHAVLRHGPAGFELADEGSTNGTLLNNAPLEPGRAAPVRHGDLVGVGRTLLLVRLPG